MQETDCRRDLPCTQQCYARRCGLSHDRQRGCTVIHPLYREAATLAKSVSSSDLQRKRIEPSGPRHGLFSQTSACVWASAEAKMNELRVAPRLCAHPSTSTKTESWMNQWIDALTLPPPSGTSVLATVYSPKRGKSFLCVAALVDVGVGELWGLKRGRDLDLNAPEDFVLSGDCEVTHWMPLPELPNGAKREQEIRITERGLHRARWQNALPHSGTEGFQICRDRSIRRLHRERGEPEPRGRGMGIRQRAGIRRCKGIRQCTGI